MRFAPPGLCLNNFEVLAIGSEYHLLHPQGPWTANFDEKAMETSYGHAWNYDLVDWEPLGPCFGVSAPGNFDDSGVWAMHTIPLASGTAMAYTGVTTRPWAEQSVGLAYTDHTDATGWRRVRRDPIVLADPRWYRADQPGMAWRDPFVVPGEGDKWAMAVCASDRDLPLERSGCVGFATSDDLVHWQVQRPILSPGDIDELECPVLERIPQGWLMLGSVAGTRQIHAWIAAELRGRWQSLGPIAPPGPYAPRLISSPKGELLMLHTVQRRTGLCNEGKPCRGMLAQPKLLDLSDPVQPRVRWWPSLDSYFLSAGKPGQTSGMVTLPINGRLAVALRHSAETPTLELRCEDRRLELWRPGGGEVVELTTAPTQLRLLLVGEFIEVYADDDLVFCTSDYGHRIPPVPRTGSGRGKELELRPAASLAAARDDVSSVFPPGPPTIQELGVSVPLE
jgi:beta-fructofuranosidase